MLKSKYKIYLLLLCLTGCVSEYNAQLPSSDEELLVVTTNGYGKRTPVKEYKVQARGGKGLLTYDKSKFKKTGPLVGAIVVDDDDEVLLINSEGTIIRIKASEVSKLGRATQGVKIMRTDEDTNIISIAKVINEEEHAEDAKKALEKKAKEKAKKEDDGSEQTTLDL